VDPSGGLDFNFEFNQTESPFYNSASASGNDVLRLTDATPFSSALSSQNVINIYLGVGTIDLNDTFRGGFFTDTNLSFFSSLSNASFVYYQVNVSGPVVYNSVNYSVYSGPYSFQVSTVAETANFASGSVNGFVMQLQAIPEPSAAWLVGIGLAGVLVMAFRRGRV
jgi:hypothetical protein